MALKNHSLNQQPAAEAGYDPTGLLFGLDDKQLLKIRHSIDMKLGIGTLESLDVGHEIMLQLTKLKIMQQEALEDTDAPHGQRAQAGSAVSKLLQDLTKCRVALNNAEVSKKLDAMVIECMHDAPEEAKTAFFAHLERLQSTLPTLASLMPTVSELTLDEE